MMMSNKDKTTLEAYYEFENGRARMLNKGVYFWNGSEDDISADNPVHSFDALVYKLIGAEDVWSEEYDLKGIKITIEIEESNKQ